MQSTEGKTVSKLRFALTTAGVIAAVGAISVASAAHSGNVSNVNHTSTNISINGYTKDQCKDGGWQSFGVFKNQGDCVSYFATGGKNPPAGH